MFIQIKGLKNDLQLVKDVTQAQRIVIKQLKQEIKRKKL